MKKRLIVTVIIIALVIGIPAVILANDNEEGPTLMSTNTTIPLIDTMKPATTKTATFALG